MPQKTPGYLKIGAFRQCGRLTPGEYALTLTPADVCFGWLFLSPLLNRALVDFFAVEPHKKCTQNIEWRNTQGPVLKIFGLL
jgi:hypothetical protein